MSAEKSEPRGSVCKLLVHEALGQIDVSRDLGYVSPAAFARLVSDLDEVARMLHGLRSKVDGA